MALRDLVTTLLIQIVLTLPAFGRIVGEVPVAPPVYGNAPGDQLGAVVGSDGENFLSVWADGREGNEGLYAARFNGSGVLLDPTGIRIPASTAANRSLMTVLSIRRTWIVFWSEQIFTPDTPAPRSNVMLVRIDSNGRLIDGPRVAIPDAYGARAATNGSRIIVTYADKYALLDENAMLLRRDLPLPISPTTPNSAPIVASNGTDFMITWAISVATRADILGVGVNTNGDFIGFGARLINAGDETPMALASDGSDYLMVTQKGQARQFSARRLSSESQALAVPTLLPVINGIPDVSGDLIWTGTSYLFATGTTVETATSAYQQAFGVRLDRSGLPLDSEPFPLSNPSTSFRGVHVAIASNDREVVSVWQTMAATSGNDIFATVMSGASLRRSDPILLSRSANPQTNPALAFSGRNYLALWQDIDGTYAGRISLDGQALDGRGIRLTPAGYNPRVIFDGANYLAGWLTSGNGLAILWVSRVTPDGEVLDGGDGVPVASSTCVFNFDLVSAGDRTLVAWDECGYKAIRVERLDHNARPIDIPLVITPTQMQTANPRLAWNGSEYLVAFQEQIAIPSILLCPSCVSFRSNVRAVRISSELTVLDTKPLAVAVSDSEDQTDPYAASNGKDFLVGWTPVRAREVAADGTLGTTLTLGTGALSSLIWDGFRYASAYSNGDAFLTHVGSGDQLVISATGDAESMPRLVATGNGNVTAAYVRVATEPLYGGVSRVFMREPTSARARPVRSR